MATKFSLNAADFCLSEEQIAAVNLTVEMGSEASARFHQRYAALRVILLPSFVLARVKALRDVGVEANAVECGVIEVRLPLASWLTVSPSWSAPNIPAPSSRGYTRSTTTSLGEVVTVIVVAAVCYATIFYIARGIIRALDGEHDRAA